MLHFRIEIISDCITGSWALTNPLWQQGKKGRKKKEKKEKNHLTTWRTFLEQSFLWRANSCIIFISYFGEIPSTVSDTFVTKWTYLKVALGKKSRALIGVWWDESDNPWRKPTQSDGMEKQPTLKEKVKSQATKSTHFLFIHFLIFYLFVLYFSS